MMSSASIYYTLETGAAAGVRQKGVDHSIFFMQYYGLIKTLDCK